MEWTRSQILALALHNCSQCRGSGLRLGSTSQVSPCNCVLRAIFRICYERFIRCVSQERYLSKVSLEPHCGRQRPSTWGRKDEEYIADFCLVARRTLQAEEHRLFRLHFLLGADWKLCARRMGIDRGNFYHAVYRIEQKLGRTFRELQPYPLFPVDEYFHGPSRFGPAEAPRREAFAGVPARLRFPQPAACAV
jgi:predicted DNA-binding protein (UPF0251 family)